MNSLLEDRNQSSSLLEHRAMLPTDLISYEGDTLFIVAGYACGKALYSAPRDKPLSTTLLAYAETVSSGDQKYTTRADSSNLVVSPANQSLVHPLKEVATHSNLPEANSFTAEYILQRYTAACSFASQAH